MGLYLPLKHISPGMRRWSSPYLLTTLGAVLLMASGCGPAGGENETTDVATEPAIEAPRPTSTTAAPASPSTEPSATPVAPTREPVIAGTPGRVVDPADDSATPDAGTPAGRPAPVLGRQRPAASDDAPQSTPEPDRPPAGTPAPAPGDGTTGASHTGPGGSNSNDATAEAETAPDATLVDSCTPAEVPEFGGAADAFVVAENLFFRTGPGTDCDLIEEGALQAGTELLVTSDTVVRQGQNTEWVRVNVDGQEGWVAAEFIEPQSE